MSARETRVDLQRVQTLWDASVGMMRIDPYGLCRRPHHVTPRSFEAVVGGVKNGWIEAASESPNPPEDELAAVGADAQREVEISGCHRTPALLYARNVSVLEGLDVVQHGVDRPSPRGDGRRPRPLLPGRRRHRPIPRLNPAPPRSAAPLGAPRPLATALAMRRTKKEAFAAHTPISTWSRNVRPSKRTGRGWVRAKRIYAPSPSTRRRRGPQHQAREGSTGVTAAPIRLDTARDAQVNSCQWRDN